MTTRKDRQEYIWLTNSARVPPWETEPFSLVSWWDVEKFAADHFCALAAWIEQQAAWYRNNAGKGPPGAIPTWNQFRALQRNLDNLVVQCKAIGLCDSADSITEFRNSFAPKWGPTYERVGWHLDEIAKGIQREMKRTLFLFVPLERAQWYQAPRKDWDKALERFGEKIAFDVEESAKCFACDRYTAAVFHVMRVAEFGALAVGDLLEMKDAKPGWHGVLERMRQILAKKYADLTPCELKHHKLLESLMPLMEAMQSSWRYKIIHPANELALVFGPGEVQPCVAQDILTTTRAFMRTLALELPRPVVS